MRSVPVDIRSAPTQVLIPARRTRLASTSAMHRTSSFSTDGVPRERTARPLLQLEASPSASTTKS